MVLVVADDTDTTADGVCAVLAERGVPYFRFDTAEFPGRLQLDVRLDVDDEAPGWTGRLRHVERPGKGGWRVPGGMASCRG